MQTGLLQKENRASSFRAAVGQLQRKCACGQHILGGGECAQCGKKQTLYRHSTRTARQTTPREAPPILHETLRSPGLPLDASTRGFMESRLSHDFSHVRVHTDEWAAESRRAVNALAYTVGRDVVISSEHFQPGSSTGRRLLAHELTHVVQQAGARTSRQLLCGADHREDRDEWKRFRRPSAPALPSSRKWGPCRPGQLLYGTDNGRRNHGQFGYPDRQDAAGPVHCMRHVSSKVVKPFDGDE